MRHLSGSFRCAVRKNSAFAQAALRLLLINGEMKYPLNRRVLIPCALSATAGLLLVLLLLGITSTGSEIYFRSQVELFLKINRSLSTWPLFWQNVTEFGDALILFPFFSFLIYRNPQVWAALFGAVPLSCLLSSLGKHLASVPRPAAVLAHDQFTILGPTLTAQNSLPSGHTITVFAVVTVIVGSLVSFERGGKGGWWVLAGFLFAAIVSVSRIAVGAHWPLDVVTGACFGIIGGASGILLARHSTRWWDWLLARRAQGAFGVCMLAWGLVLGYDSVVVTHNELVVPWIAALYAIAVGTYLLIRSFLPQVVALGLTVEPALTRLPVNPGPPAESARKLLD